MKLILKNEELENGAWEDIDYINTALKDLNNFLAECKSIERMYGKITGIKVINECEKAISKLKDMLKTRVKRTGGF